MIRIVNPCPALMFQGVASDVGKSLLTAALCRIFLQDGLRPAPFKAQNMALNSCATDAGEEMGRAQVLQALAAGRRPDIRMNPVLLKPSSHTGSQVIVMGKAVGNMEATEYLRYKPVARRAVEAAYDSLAAEADVMVLEGAGSPAEINLKAHDIANMHMARHAQAKVLLIGDIDRGGVFAALLGTWELLEPEERTLVAGFILNKFRGDAGLLAPAPELISARTGRPFLGIMPWLEKLGLPEEDSVGFKSGRILPDGVSAPGDGILDIVLIDLPHISNFTDADPLRAEPDVALRIVRRAEDLGRPDAILVPGSKNSLHDLRFLETSGLADLLGRSEKRPVTVGICGGLQMLGLSLHDPLGVEGGGSAPGLGLLPLVTEFGPEKTVRQSRGSRSGFVVEGFELHHGESRAVSEARPFLQNERGEALGWAVGPEDWPDIWGTYLHGIFDADLFRRAFLDNLRLRRGLAPLGRVTPYDLNPALNRLAASAREHLNLAGIYALLDLQAHAGHTPILREQENPPGLF